MTQALSSDMAATDQWWRYVLNLGGSRPEATSLPPSILLFSFPLVDSTWVWAKPAHPLPNILMQFIQSNSFIKFTLMFNVLQKSACMPLLAELILWITSHAEQHSTKKWGVRAHLDPHTARKCRGSGPQDPHRIAATATDCRWTVISARSQVLSVDCLGKPCMKKTTM